MSPRKYLILSHHPCQDGYAAATIVRRQLVKMGVQPDAIHWLPGKYNESENLLPEINKDWTVYIVDFSMPPAVMVEMAKKANLVVWMDHHESAIKDWDAYKAEHPEKVPGFVAFLARENEMSGAALAWRFWHPDGDMPPMIAAVDDRDRWQWAIDTTANYSAYLESLPLDNFAQFEGALFEMDGDSLWAFFQAGEALRRKDTERVRLLVLEGCRTHKFMGVDFHTLNCPYFLASEAGDYVLANSYGTHDVAMLWSVERDKVTFSLRSKKGGTNVADFAKLYGGGGHAQAAGFKLSLAHARAKFPFLWE